jgi:uncharacterized membrane protein YbhN (UPF0104 family)
LPPGISVWLARLKPVVRWLVVLAAIAFLGHTLVRYWDEVSALRLGAQGWRWVGLSLGVTLVAHAWAGWVWSWALQALQQPIAGGWSTTVYLQTNLLKYLPGNVWHFWGRVRALQSRGVDLGTALLGVALEPLLMAAAALVIGIATPTRYWPLQLVLLGLVLELLAPRRLNPLARRLGRSKTKAQTSAAPVAAAPGLTHYPLRPLVGQLIYVVLRGVGFGLLLGAVVPLAAADWLPTLSAFSLAWLAGLVVPGAPGGLGVFEAIALGLLQGRFAPAAVLSAVVLYRLVNTLAEALGAALGSLGQRLFGTLK